MCPPMWAHWRHLANVIELMLPSAHLSSQPKQPIPDQFRHFSTAHGRKSVCFTMGDPFPKIAPSHRGSGPPSNTWFLGSDAIRAHNPSGISIGSNVFAQITAECPYTLQWDAPFSLKIAVSHEGICTLSNAWFPGSTRVLNPNDISIGSDVFAGLTSVTDRRTGHTTRSVTIDHIYVLSTAMRHNNNTDLTWKVYSVEEISNCCIYLTCWSLWSYLSQVQRSRSMSEFMAMGRWMFFFQLWTRSIDWKIKMKLQKPVTTHWLKSRPEFETVNK